MYDREMFSEIQKLLLMICSGPVSTRVNTAGWRFPVFCGFTIDMNARLLQDENGQTVYSFDNTEQLIELLSVIHKAYDTGYGVGHRDGLVDSHEDNN